MNVFKVIVYPVAVLYGVALFMSLFGIAFKGRSLEYYYRLGCQFDIKYFIETGKLERDTEQKPVPAVPGVSSPV
jgi:hypothetical protein